MQCVGFVIVDLDYLLTLLHLRDFALADENRGNTIGELACEFFELLVFSPFSNLLNKCSFY